MPHDSTYPPVKISERPYHEMLLDAIDKTIADGKNKIAFVSGDNPKHFITFEQLRKDAFAVAMYLHSIGFKVCGIMLKIWEFYNSTRERKYFKNLSICSRQCLKFLISFRKMLLLLFFQTSGTILHFSLDVPSTVELYLELVHFSLTVS